MHEAFISVVVPVDRHDDTVTVVAFLAACAAELQANFADYEVIVVDNRSGCRLDDTDLDSEYAKNCSVLSLAGEVSWDVAVYAGLERANGDYVAVFDSFQVGSTELITQMYREAQAGYDYVVLEQPLPSWPPRVQRRAFFWFLGQSGASTMRLTDRRELLVSRRALNWALRHRSRAQYIHELYTAGGFAATRLPVHLDAGPERRSARHRSEIAWGALARMTDYPLRLAHGSLALLSTILVLAVANALCVRLVGRNLVGGAEENIPGWAYLVMLLSVGFLLTNVTLYAVLRIVRVLADDMRDDPLYVVEQTRRLD